MRRGRKKADPCGQRGGSSALKSGFVGTATASGRNGLQSVVSINWVHSFVVAMGRVQNAMDAKLGGWSMLGVTKMAMETSQGCGCRMDRWPPGVGRFESCRCTALHSSCKARAWLRFSWSFFFCFGGGCLVARGRLTGRTGPTGLADGTYAGKDPGGRAWSFYI